MNALPAQPRAARPSTQWIEPTTERQPAPAADAAAERPASNFDERPPVRRIKPLPSAPDEYIDTNTPSCPPTPQYEVPPPFELLSEGHGGESTGHALGPLPEVEEVEEQERDRRRSRRGSSNKTLQICFSRWAAQVLTAIKGVLTAIKNRLANKISRWTNNDKDKWKLAEHTELFALVCCQFGMWFSVIEAALACEYDRPSVCRPPSLSPPFGD